MELRLSELSERVGAKLDGDAGTVVHGVAPLDRAGPGEVTYLAGPRHRRSLPETNAAAVILTESFRPECPVAALVCENPELVFARVVEALAGERQKRAGIHATAWVDDGAEVHPSAYVGPHCTVECGVHVGAGAEIGSGSFLGAECRIGEDTVLMARVSVYPGVTLGRRCLVHAGAVLGSDGFGLARDGDRWIKIPQLGSLSIGDDVEIGANTTIDRGAMDDTIVEEGVKLDNQIQIGHNVFIGANTAIAGCAGVAGSTRIGRGCTIGGGACVAGHIEIADAVHVGGMAGVSKSLHEPGAYASGTLVEPLVNWRRNSARFRHLDELARRVRKLEARLDELDDDEGS